MNRVYKVIWSKAKHCYVVTSEIAKGYGKSAGSKGVKALLSGLVALSIAMGGYGLAGAVFVESKNAEDGVYNTPVYTTAEVYTKSEIGDNFATKDELKAKANAADVQVSTDGEYVKKDKKVGENLSALDTEVKTVEVAVNNVVDTVGELGGKYTALDGKVQAEVADRKAADQNNLKINGDGEILKVKDDGTEAVKKLVLNKDGKNQITLSKNGIKVGKNNTVIASDGSIKGAGGAFTVDKNGNVTSTATITGETVTDGKGASMSNGTVTGKTLTDGIATITNGSINTTGTVTGGTVTSTGNISAVGEIHAGGDITGASASFIGDIHANGAIQGKSISDGTATMKNGDITGVKNLSAETITTHGDLTVNGKLNMDEIDMTKVGIVDDNNVTASTKVAAGEITSYKKATNTKDGGSEKESAIDYDEKGTSTWAKATDADGKWNKSILTVEGTGIKSTATDTDGKNKASTNLSNKGFNTFASDGTNKTYTKQTATDIKNTAEKGMISHTAKNLVNRAYENMTNTVDNDLTTTVGGEMKTTVTGNVTEDYKANLTTTVKGLATENFNNGLDTNITGNETHDVSGTMTTTVTGDSSLTAENITNEAKNKITNKAIDVETDATSSIVQKVTNDAGSNTSTQWSYQTLEEMSQADGKTASYLRGAAEEKSQLTNGAKKTTIDTVAGQTNTNITDGTNTSNDLQKADQIASSVTNGTNKTVVNQDAKSLASSITDGPTKFNNSIHWVDGSAQRIEVDDTHFYAETRTAEKAEEALKSGNTVIDIVKDTNTATVSSAVFDGKNLTGASMTAKGITNSAAESIVNEIGDGSKVKSEMNGSGITNTAKDGTIANEAKDITNTATVKLSNSAEDIENTATTSITDKVGDNTSWKMTDGTVVELVKDASGKTNQTTTTAADTYQFVKDGDNTLAKRTSSTNDNLNITDGNNTYTKITTATGNKQTVTDEMETASTNLTKEASNTLIKNGTQSVLNHIAADTSYTVMNENGNGSRRQQTASEILDRVTDGTDTSEVKQTASEVAASAKDISNTATDKITSQIGDGSAVKSEMTADGITNITGKIKVISDNDGTPL